MHLVWTSIFVPIVMLSKQFSQSVWCNNTSKGGRLKWFTACAAQITAFALLCVAVGPIVDVTDFFPVADLDDENTVRHHFKFSTLLSCGPKFHHQAVRHSECLNAPSLQESPKQDHGSYAAFKTLTPNPNALIRPIVGQMHWYVHRKHAAHQVHII